MPRRWRTCAIWIARRWGQSATSSRPVMRCWSGGWGDFVSRTRCSALALLRTAGTHRLRGGLNPMGPRSAAHPFVLRSVRGAEASPLPLHVLFFRRSGRLALGAAADDADGVAIGEAV